jgi:hypothetical protein
VDDPTKETSQAEGSMLYAEGLVDADAILQDQAQFASDPGGPAKANDDMDLTALSALPLPLADGIDLGTNLGGILTLGVGGQSGKVKTTADGTADGDTALAAAGVVNGQGLISVGGNGAENPTKLTLNPLLKVLSVNGQGLETLVNDVTLELKAVSGQATAERGKDPVGKYDVAGAKLTVESKAVKGISTGLNGVVDQLDTTLNGLIGKDNAVGQLVNGFIQPLLDTINQLQIITASISDPANPFKLELDTKLDDVLAPILKEPLGDANGPVQIDLQTGMITVDLGQIVAKYNKNCSSLNDCKPNTDLLSDDVIAGITTEVKTLLTGLTTKVDTALKTAINETHLKINIPLKASALGGITKVDLPITIDATLAQLLGTGSGSPKVEVQPSIQIGPLTIPLGGLLNPVVNLVTNTLLPGVGTAVSNIVSPLLTTTVPQLVDGVVNPVISALSPLLETIGQQLLTIQINRQEKPGNFVNPKGDDKRAFTERALFVDLLPRVKGGEGLLSLGLGNATVIGEAEASIALDPTHGKAGDKVKVTGSGFKPDTDVTITIDGKDAGTVHTDKYGNFPADATVTVPKDATEGAGKTVEAKDGTNTATATFTVDAADAATLKVDPASVEAGKEITVTGDGYTPGDKVTITVGEGDSAVTKTVTADADGKIPAGTTVTIPEDFPTGATTVTAKDEHDKSATADLTVTASTPGDANVNASASAAASAKADDDNNAAAQAAAVAAAMADASTTASAAKNGDASSAADSAASTTASTTASSDVSSDKNASASTAAQAAANADNSSATNAEASSAKDGNAGSASEAAATANSSTNASSDAAADGSGSDANSADAANADVNANAAASAGASAQADNDSNAAAQAAAEKAATADSDSAKSAAADSKANAAAQQAATADASQNASTDATTEANAAAQAAAAAAGQADATDKADAEASAAKDANANAAASSASKSTATADSDASTDASTTAASDASGDDQGATAKADSNVNASASAAASATADGDNNAGAQAAAKAAANNDASSTASAASDKDAKAAAKAAANKDASSAASADVSSKANASAQAAATAAANSKSDSDSKADATSAANGNASKAASSAANSDSSSNASGNAAAEGSDAASNANGSADGSQTPKATVKYTKIDRTKGVTQVVTGTGLKAGETVSATVHSKPIKLESKKANAKGEVTFTFEVGSGFELGDHYVAVVGSESGEITGSARTTDFTVFDSTQSGSNANGGSAGSNSSASANGSGTASGIGNGGGWHLANTGVQIGVGIAGLVALGLIFLGTVMMVRRRRHS